MRVVHLTHTPQFVSPRLRLLILRSHHNAARCPLIISRPPASRQNKEALLSVAGWRGAKTKATKKLKDLPQGVLQLETYNDGVDEAPRYPTTVQGHRNNMEKFKNCVILTRVGGFYEVLSYFRSFYLFLLKKNNSLFQVLTIAAIFRASGRIRSSPQYQTRFEEDQRRTGPHGRVPFFSARSVFEDVGTGSQQVRGNK
jgi:hypothetical protein